MYTYTQTHFFLFFEIPILQPSTYCLINSVYFSHCLFPPNIYSNLLTCHNYIYLNPRICPKPKLSYSVTTLNPLFIHLTVYVPKRLLKPIDFLEKRYLNQGICPKKRVAELLPLTNFTTISPLFYVYHCSLTPNEDCSQLKIWLFGYKQKFATVTRVEGCIAGAPTCIKLN